MKKRLLPVLFFLALLFVVSCKPSGNEALAGQATKPALVQTQTGPVTPNINAWLKANCDAFNQVRVEEQLNAFSQRLTLVEQQQGVSDDSASPSSRGSCNMVRLQTTEPGTRDGNQFCQDSGFSSCEFEIVQQVNKYHASTDGSCSGAVMFAVYPQEIGSCGTKVWGAQVKHPNRAPSAPESWCETEYAPNNPADGYDIKYDPYVSSVFCCT